MEMLGELELIRLIEENDYPARLVSSGVVWVELEITDPKTNAVRRERLSKSAFADLILDWRESHKPDLRRIGPALRKIGLAAYGNLRGTRPPVVAFIAAAGRTARPDGEEGGSDPLAAE